MIRTPLRQLCAPATRLVGPSRPAGRLRGRQLATAAAPPPASSRTRTGLITLTAAASVLAAWSLATSEPGPSKDAPKSKSKSVVVVDDASLKPAFSRDDVTAVLIIGGPSSGKTAHARRIADRFDMQYEDAESDYYSDIALNLPSSRQLGAHKLRIIIDDFPSASSTSTDPLDHVKWFESRVAPVCVVVFVDLPPEEAEKRNAGSKEGVEEWRKRMQPVIDHFRQKGNILEITGEWPADEQWEQVEAKLDSALELEARNEL